jgi:hypothetical protein
MLNGKQTPKPSTVNELFIHRLFTCSWLKEGGLCKKQQRILHTERMIEKNFVEKREIMPCPPKDLGNGISAAKRV